MADFNDRMHNGGAQGGEGSAGKGDAGERWKGKMQHDAKQEEDMLSPPQGMLRNIESLEAVTRRLLDTIKSSSTPVGRRNGCGADINALVREVIENSSRAQSMREEVEEHQARQKMVREKVNEVARAEAYIDGLLGDLQVCYMFRSRMLPLVISLLLIFSSPLIEKKRRRRRKE